MNWVESLLDCFVYVRRKRHRHCAMRRARAATVRRWEGKGEGGSGAERGAADISRPRFYDVYIPPSTFLDSPLCFLMLLFLLKESLAVLWMTTVGMGREGSYTSVW